MSPARSRGAPAGRIAKARHSMSACNLCAVIGVKMLCRFRWSESSLYAARRTTMNHSAVLLMDLQHDFLGAKGSRMPVQPEGAAIIIETANAILSKQRLTTALPILVLNQFPSTDRIGNFFRNGAAITGTPGANFDSRI